MKNIKIRILTFGLLIANISQSMQQPEKSTRKKRKRTSSEEVSSAKRIKGALSPEQFQKEWKKPKTPEKSTRKKRKRTSSEEVSSAKRIKGALSPEQFQKEWQKTRTAQELPEIAKQSVETRITQKIIAQKMIQPVLNYLKEFGPISEGFNCDDVAFSSDGNQIIITQSSSSHLQDTQLIDLKNNTHNYLKLPSGTIDEMKFSPDNKKIVINYTDKIVFLNSMTGDILHTEYANRQTQDEIYFITFTPDSTKCIMAIDNGLPQVEGQLVVLDIVNYKVLKEFKNINSAADLFVSPDSKTLLARFNNYIKIWDINTGKLIHVFINTYHTTRSNPDDINYSYVYQFSHIFNKDHDNVAFSNNSEQLAITFANNKISVWDIKKSNQLYTLKEHTDKIIDVLFSPDNKYIATASNDKTVRIHAARTGKLLHVFKLNSSPTRIVFSKDSKKIAIQSTNQYRSKIVQIRNIKTGNQLDELNKIIPEYVDSISLSLDGTKVIIESEDYTVLQVFDIKTNQEIVPAFKPGFQGFEFIWFNPEGSKAIIFDGKNVYIFLVEYTQSLQWLQNKEPGQKQFLLPDQAQIIIDMYRSHKAETQMDSFIRARDLPLNQVTILSYVYKLYAQKNNLSVDKTLSLQQMKEIFDQYINFRARNTELSQEKALSLDDAIQLLKMYQSYLKVKKELSQEDVSRYLRLPNYVRNLLEYYLLRPLVEKKEKPLIGIPLKEEQELPLFALSLQNNP